MNHLKTGNAYFAQGSYKSNKYNGKELQETGMYSYGWREYMPDIGRWNAIDQLAENYLSASPYAYVLNNPVNMFDPDGRISESFIANIMGFPSCTSFHNNNDGSWGINGGSMVVNDNGVLLSRHSAGGGSCFMGGSVAGTIELPGVTLNGYGSANHWGGAISTYNINHSILYNGIAGIQAAWNYANRPVDPMAWVRTHGPVQMMSGDMFGFSDLAGIGLERISEDHPYIAMGLGVLGAVGLKKAGLAKFTEYEITSTAVRTALADRIGKRGFTEVGYQFQKHFSRGGDWVIPQGVTKNPAMYNQAGYKTFKEIWRAPGSFENVGGFIEKRLPDGRGLRFQENWKFKGFLD